MLYKYFSRTKTLWCDETLIYDVFSLLKYGILYLLI